MLNAQHFVVFILHFRFLTIGKKKTLALITFDCNYGQYDAGTENVLNLIDLFPGLLRVSASLSFSHLRGLVAETA